VSCAFGRRQPPLAAGACQCARSGRNAEPAKQHPPPKTRVMNTTTTLCRLRAYRACVAAAAAIMASLAQGERAVPSPNCSESMSLQPPKTPWEFTQDTQREWLVAALRAPESLIGTSFGQTDEADFTGCRRRMTKTWPLASLVPLSNVEHFERAWVALGFDNMHLEVVGENASPFERLMSSIATVASRALGSRH